MNEEPKNGLSNPLNQLNNQKQKLWLRRVAIFVVIALVLGFVYWFLFMRNRVRTDDAYVFADSAMISSRVPGTLLRVRVENDSAVEVGQVLMELDPRDYQVAVDERQAALNRVEADIRATEVSISQTEIQTGAQVKAARAQVEEAHGKVQELRHRREELRQKEIAAEADLTNVRRDFERYDRLYDEEAIAEQQWDRAKTNLEKSLAQREGVAAEIAEVESAMKSAGEAVNQTEAQLKVSEGDRYRVEVLQHNLSGLKAKRDEARAALQAAQLNRSYCTISAPIAGYIAQKKVQTGDRVQPGQALMAVVPLQDVYVEANFKEIQLKNVRIGQRATIEADVYSGHSFHGKVVGIRAGTGAAFSLLPPENATGNWIKVVQRVPVKIKLDETPPPERALRVGLSLEVTIHTEDRSGPTLLPSSAGPR